jgi:ADP-ribosylglycohydrolase
VQGVDRYMLNIQTVEQILAANEKLPIGMKKYKRIPSVFPKAKHMDELLTLVKKAIVLSSENEDDLDAIRQLGEGWVAEETLAIAIYCALKYSDDFVNGVAAAVNHDGDSDSTGAVTGNILGTALGFEAIPQKYLDKLELKDVILEIAEDLHHDCQITEYGLGDDLWESISFTDGAVFNFSSFPT